MDTLEAEGWVYLEMHFKDHGFIPHRDSCDVFAFHSKLKWKEVFKIIKSQWGYLRFFTTAKLLKKTKMKNGETNFVFVLK